MINILTSGHHVGDCRALLARLPPACVQTCVTSPPYWGLRDYGVDGQLGLEATPEEYIINMVEVFAGVWRVLKDDGTLWLNIGDCYAGSRSGPQGDSGEMADRSVATHRSFRSQTKGIDPKNPRKGPGSNGAPNRQRHEGLKHKDLVGIPWMLAFALRSAGWYLRMDIIWSKPNPMPESVLDRPTKAHEYVFLLSKSERYFYDVGAIREPVTGNAHDRGHGVNPKAAAAAPGSRQNPSWSAAVNKASGYKSGNKERKIRADHGGAPDTGTNQAFGVPWEDEDGLRNKRSVWTVATQPYSGAHFATFPPKLIEPCILAGSRTGDLVLDIFHGSGTTGMVAEKHGRRWIGFDISSDYAELAKGRTAQRSLMGALERIEGK